jgi:hypothetical protein
LVESLDDFAELVLHVHRDRLKEAIGTSSLPLTDKVWHNNCSRVLVLFLVGGLPNRGVYHSYGFTASGIAGVVLLAVVVLLLTGRL